MVFCREITVVDVVMPDVPVWLLPSSKGEAPVNGCPVGGAAVGAKVGEIMGVAAEDSVRQVAFVKCAGTCEKAGTGL